MGCYLGCCRDQDNDELTLLNNNNRSNRIEIISNKSDNDIESIEPKDELYYQSILDEEQEKLLNNSKKSTINRPSKEISNNIRQTLSPCEITTSPLNPLNSIRYSHNDLLSQSEPINIPTKVDMIADEEVVLITSQTYTVLPGIISDVDTSDIQNMMKEQQEELKNEYEHKLADLESEREAFEEEKALVDRYKQLLLKQRDIMIALTQRLVERDEQIMALQNELDLYDKHQCELENTLDEKTTQLITLQRMLIVYIEKYPPNNNEELEELNRIFETSGINEQSSEDTNDNDNTNNEIFQSNSDNDLDNDSNLDYSNDSNSEKISQNDYNQVSLILIHKDELKSIIEQELQNQLIILNSDTSLKILSDPLVSVVNTIFTKLFNYTNEIISYLKAENEVLSNKLKHLTNTDIPEKQIAIQQLQTRCDTLVKDREAVQTIMEHKIKVLIDSVAQATASIVSSTTAINVTDNSKLNYSNVVKTLSKDVAALQRLVDATIAALNNSDTLLKSA